MAAAVSVGGGGGRRGGLPQSAAMMNLLTDMAFNLLIFFVVLADPSAETGRSQQIPSAKDETAAQQTSESIMVNLRDPDKSAGRVFLNGDPVTMEELTTKLREMLKDRKTQEERIVVIDSTEDTPYRWYILATAKIEQAGGVVALQLEETKEVTLP
jgi:biopolymer transport protein ExbD